MKPPPEVEQVVLARDGHRNGDEIQFRCPCPESHQHGDANPSARYNRKKGVWRCDVCEVGGGWKDLCERLDLRYQSTSEILATYPYTDEAGEVLFEVVRKAGARRFVQRRPDGSGGWIWNLKGVRRVLYRLREVLAAIKEGKRIFLGEGEKDVDNLYRLGLVGTTNAGGAGKFTKELAKSLQGARVCILPDNDKAGRDHAKKVARLLQGVAAEVRILPLPALPEKGDVSDWVAAMEEQGRSLPEIGAELERLAEEAPVLEAPADEGGESNETQGQTLMRLAADVELFHTPDGEAYATFLVGTHAETYPVGSKPFRRWLMQRFYRETGKAPGSQARQDAIELLKAAAQYDGDEQAVFLRTAEKEGVLYLDLCQANWDVIEITKRGYRLVSDPPVKFRRTNAMLPLPAPERGGTVQELRPFVNVASDADFLLLVCWLVAALCPFGPYPILILNGEQGSAKSTLVRLLRSLVDAVKALLRAAPGGERDLIISASNSWVLAFDNLSALRDWLADALCRIATGGGYSARTLYTDAEETIFDAQRPIILNGITDLATRPDLADRAIVLSLEPIAEEQRRTEKELWAAFEVVRPRILGALLGAVSAAMGRVESVQLPAKPRMADFAVWATAAEVALGYQEGDFLAAYMSNRANAVEVALDADPVAVAVRALLAVRAEWSGTSTELLEVLAGYETERTQRSKDWPKSANHLSGKLKRAATALRSLGVEVGFSRGTGRDRRRVITLRRSSVGGPPVEPADDGAALRTQVRTQDHDRKLLSAKELDDADDADARLQLESTERDRVSV